MSKLIDYLCRIAGLDRYTVPLPPRSEVTLRPGDKRIACFRRLYCMEDSPVNTAIIDLDFYREADGSFAPFHIKDLSGRTILDSAKRPDDERHAVGCIRIVLDDQQFAKALELQKEEKKPADAECPF